MKIVSWNVNSVRARLDHLLDYLDAEGPEVICLQELKCEEHAFPYEAVGELGYEAAVYGQRAYNGVAILSQLPIEAVTRGPGPQARALAATINGLRVVSVYAPNGDTVGSDKWRFKLDFFSQLLAFAAAQPPGPRLLCGDFNVAPEDLDVADPPAWAASVLCHPLARQALAALLAAGNLDTLRHHAPTDARFSWWDYRRDARARGDGLRIDLILANPSAAPLIREAFVHEAPRDWPRPSDHAPVGVDLDAARLAATLGG
ncbi:exodeoxyribonuclease III [Myxococcota bacterium]|nr:exodeoxyribonuclease III [Myxococcota bacterium]